MIETVAIGASAEVLSTFGISHKDIPVVEKQPHWKVRSVPPV